MLIFLIIIFGYLLIGLGGAIIYGRYSNEGWDKDEDGDILGAILGWPIIVVIGFFTAMIWIVRKAGGRD